MELQADKFECGEDLVGFLRREVEENEISDFLASTIFPSGWRNCLRVDRTTLSHTRLLSDEIV
jgi:hypothetical protein